MRLRRRPIMALERSEQEQLETRRDWSLSMLKRATDTDFAWFLTPLPLAVSENRYLREVS